MTTSVWMIAALRTAVIPRGGHFREMTAPQLATPVIVHLLRQLGLSSDVVEYVILGNALYGGGNPARLAALAADIPESVAAVTIDSQCCGGIDSIKLAAGLIAAGQHDFILTGGLESYSTSPRRITRANGEEYLRPAFTPWPNRDPDMLEAAAELAKQANITRNEQETFAILSHEKARKSVRRLQQECVAISRVNADAFTRVLSERLCQRLPVLAGQGEFGLTSATVAVEADAAALCALVSDRFLKKHPLLQEKALRIARINSCGSDPCLPGLAPINASRNVLKDLGISAHSLGVCEVMEAFSSQAIVCIREIGFNLTKANLGGGALARGHPIGASGAINVVRLYNEMRRSDANKWGLATIAGAGGLGSAVVLST